jgi:hypothetical protein
MKKNLVESLGYSKGSTKIKVYNYEKPYEKENSHSIMMHSNILE